MLRQYNGRLDFTISSKSRNTEGQEVEGRQAMDGRARVWKDHDQFSGSFLLIFSYDLVKLVWD